MSAMSKSAQPSLFDAPATAPPAAPDPDAAARQFAVDPRNNVVLQASAGTGKTSVLVARYVNLLQSGVDPSNILAILSLARRPPGCASASFVSCEPQRARATARWSSFAIASATSPSAIDAFCLSLLREFPSRRISTLDLKSPTRPGATAG
jgi:hypothetical protein